MHIQTKMNAYKDFHSFTCISMIKSCVTDLVLKNKTANSQVIFLKSRVIFNVSYYRHTTQKFVHTKINVYSNENEGIYRISYSACRPVF